jgi:thioredoxin 1
MWAIRVKRHLIVSRDLSRQMGVRLLDARARLPVKVEGGKGYPMASIEPLTNDDIESNVLEAPGPIALDFYQAGCTPCQALEPRLERIAAQYLGRVRVYRVDVERDLSLAERFGVKSLPALLILRSGREVERLDGLDREPELSAPFERASRA